MHRERKTEWGPTLVGVLALASAGLAALFFVFWFPVMFGSTNTTLMTTSSIAPGSDTVRLKLSHVHAGDAVAEGAASARTAHSESVHTERVELRVPVVANQYADNTRAVPPQMRVRTLVIDGADASVVMGMFNTEVCNFPNGAFNTQRVQDPGAPPCACAPGSLWTGPHCDRCTLWPNATDPCNGRGVLTNPMQGADPDFDFCGAQHHLTQCACFAGHWGGRWCDECPFPYVEDDRGNGTCMSCGWCEPVNPCMHGGACAEGAPVSTPTPGLQLCPAVGVCTAPPGTHWTGDVLEWCPPQWDQQTCSQCDLCAGNPCRGRDGSGTCDTDLTCTSIACTCSSPNFDPAQRCQACANQWAGTQCNECPVCAAPGQCLNGGTCAPDANCTAPVCTCPAGFFGDRCQWSCDACTPGQCQNGGSCTAQPEPACPGGTAHRCSCPHPWDGPACEQCAGFLAGAQCAQCTVCDHVACANGGTCAPTTDTCTLEDACTCTEHWAGPTCDVCPPPLHATQDPTTGDMHCTECEACRGCEGTCVDASTGAPAAFNGTACPADVACVCDTLTAGALPGLVHQHGNLIVAPPTPHPAVGIDTPFEFLPPAAPPLSNGTTYAVWQATVTVPASGRFQIAHRPALHIAVGAGPDAAQVRVLSGHTGDALASAPCTTSPCVRAGDRVLTSIAVGPRAVRVVVQDAFDGVLSLTDAQAAAAIPAAQALVDTPGASPTVLAPRMPPAPTDTWDVLTARVNITATTTLGVVHGPALLDGDADTPQQAVALSAQGFAGSGTACTMCEGTNLALAVAVRRGDASQVRAALVRPSDNTVLARLVAGTPALGTGGGAAAWSLNSTQPAQWADVVWAPMAASDDALPGFITDAPSATVAGSQAPSGSAWYTLAGDPTAPGTWALEPRVSPSAHPDALANTTFVWRVPNDTSSTPLHIAVQPLGAPVEPHDTPGWAWMRADVLLSADDDAFEIPPRRVRTFTGVPETLGVVDVHLTPGLADTASSGWDALVLVATLSTSTPAPGQNSRFTALLGASGATDNVLRIQFVNNNKVNFEHWANNSLVAVLDGGACVQVPCLPTDGTQVSVVWAVERGTGRAMISAVDAETLAVFVWHETAATAAVYADTVGPLLAAGRAAEWIVGMWETTADIAQAGALLLSETADLPWFLEAGAGSLAVAPYSPHMLLRREGPLGTPVRLPPVTNLGPLANITTYADTTVDDQTLWFTPGGLMRPQDSAGWHVLVMQVTLPGSFPGAAQQSRFGATLSFVHGHETFLRMEVANNNHILFELETGGGGPQPSFAAWHNALCANPPCIPRGQAVSMGWAVERATGRTVMTAVRPSDLQVLFYVDATPPSDVAAVQNSVKPALWGAIAWRGSAAMTDIAALLPAHAPLPWFVDTAVGSTMAIAPFPPHALGAGAANPHPIDTLAWRTGIPTAETVGLFSGAARVADIQNNKLLLGASVHVLSGGRGAVLAWDFCRPGDAATDPRTLGVVRVTVAGWGAGGVGLRVGPCGGTVEGAEDNGSYAASTQPATEDKAICGDNEDFAPFPVGPDAERVSVGIAIDTNSGETTVVLVGAESRTIINHRRFDSAFGIVCCSKKCPKIDPSTNNIAELVRGAVARGDPTVHASMNDGSQWSGYRFAYVPTRGVISDVVSAAFRPSDAGLPAWTHGGYTPAPTDPLPSSFAPETTVRVGATTADGATLVLQTGAQPALGVLAFSELVPTSFASSWCTTGGGGVPAGTPLQVHAAVRRDSNATLHAVMRVTSDRVLAWVQCASPQNTEDVPLPRIEPGPLVFAAVSSGTAAPQQQWTRGVGARIPPQAEALDLPAWIASPQNATLSDTPGISTGLPSAENAVWTRLDAPLPSDFGSLALHGPERRGGSRCTSCAAHWGGPRCNQCDLLVQLDCGYFGNAALIDPARGCTPGNTHCVCQPHYTGDTCDTFSLRELLDDPDYTLYQWQGNAIVAGATSFLTGNTSLAPPASSSSDATWDVMVAQVTPGSMEVGAVLVEDPLDPTQGALSFSLCTAGGTAMVLRGVQEGSPVAEAACTGCAGTGPAFAAFAVHRSERRAIGVLQDAQTLEVRCAVQATGLPSTGSSPTWIPTGFPTPAVQPPQQWTHAAWAAVPDTSALLPAWLAGAPPTVGAPLPYRLLDSLRGERHHGGAQFCRACGSPALEDGRWPLFAPVDGTCTRNPCPHGTTGRRCQQMPESTPSIPDPRPGVTADDGNVFDEGQWVPFTWAGALRGNGFADDSGFPTPMVLAGALPAAQVPQCRAAFNAPEAIFGDMTCLLVVGAPIKDSLLHATAPTNMGNGPVLWSPRDTAAHAVGAQVSGAMPTRTAPGLVFESPALSETPLHTLGNSTQLQHRLWLFTPQHFLTTAAAYFAGQCAYVASNGTIGMAVCPPSDADAAPFRAFAFAASNGLLLVRVQGTYQCVHAETMSAVACASTSPRFLVRRHPMPASFSGDGAAVPDVDDGFRCAADTLNTDNVRSMARDPCWAGTGGVLRAPPRLRIVNTVDSSITDILLARGVAELFGGNADAPLRVNATLCTTTAESVCRECGGPWWTTRVAGLVASHAADEQTGTCTPVGSTCRNNAISPAPGICLPGALPTPPEVGAVAGGDAAFIGTLQFERVDAPTPNAGNTTVDLPPPSGTNGWALVALVLDDGDDDFSFELGDTLIVERVGNTTSSPLAGTLHVCTPGPGGCPEGGSSAQVAVAVDTHQGTVVVAVSQAGAMIVRASFVHTPPPTGNTWTVSAGSGAQTSRMHALDPDLPAWVYRNASMDVWPLPASAGPVGGDGLPQRDDPWSGNGVAGDAGFASPFGLANMLVRPGGAPRVVAVTALGAGAAGNFSAPAGRSTVGTGAFQVPQSRAGSPMPQATSPLGVEWARVAVSHEVPAQGTVEWETNTRGAGSVFLHTVQGQLSTREAMLLGMCLEEQRIQYVQWGVVAWPSGMQVQLHEMGAFAVDQHSDTDGLLWFLDTALQVQDVHVTVAPLTLLDRPPAGVAALARYPAGAVEDRTTLLHPAVRRVTGASNGWNVFMASVELPASATGGATSRIGAVFRGRESPASVHSLRIEIANNNAIFFEVGETFETIQSAPCTSLAGGTQCIPTGEPVTLVWAVGNSSAVFAGVRESDRHLFFWSVAPHVNVSAHLVGMQTHVRVPWVPCARTQTVWDFDAAGMLLADAQRCAYVNGEGLLQTETCVSSEMRAPGRQYLQRVPLLAAWDEDDCRRVTVSRTPRTPAWTRALHADACATAGVSGAAWALPYTLSGGIRIDYPGPLHTGAGQERWLDPPARAEGMRGTDPRAVVDVLVITNVTLFDETFSVLYGHSGAERTPALNMNLVGNRNVQVGAKRAGGEPGLFSGTALSCADDLSVHEDPDSPEKCVLRSRRYTLALAVARDTGEATVAVLRRGSSADEMDVVLRLQLPGTTPMGEQAPWSSGGFQQTDDATLLQQLRTVEAAAGGVGRPAVWWLSSTCDGCQTQFSGVRGASYAPRGGDAGALPWWLADGVDAGDSSTRAMVPPPARGQVQTYHGTITGAADQGARSVPLVPGVPAASSGELPSFEDVWYILHLRDVTAASEEYFRVLLQTPAGSQLEIRIGGGKVRLQADGFPTIILGECANAGCPPGDETPFEMAVALGPAQGTIGVVVRATGSGELLAAASAATVPDAAAWSEFVGTWARNGGNVTSIQWGVATDAWASVAGGAEAAVVGMEFTNSTWWLRDLDTLAHSQIAPDTLDIVFPDTHDEEHVLQFTDMPLETVPSLAPAPQGTEGPQVRVCTTPCSQEKAAALARTPNGDAVPTGGGSCVNLGVPDPAIGGLCRAPRQTLPMTGAPGALPPVAPTGVDDASVQLWRGNGRLDGGGWGSPLVLVDGSGNVARIHAMPYRVTRMGPPPADAPSWFHWAQADVGADGVVRGGAVQTPDAVIGGLVPGDVPVQMMDNTTVGALLRGDPVLSGMAVPGMDDVVRLGATGRLATYAMSRLGVCLALSPECTGVHAVACPPSVDHSAVDVWTTSHDGTLIARSAACGRICFGASGGVLRGALCDTMQVSAVRAFPVVASFADAADCTTLQANEAPEVPLVQLACWSGTHHPAGPVEITPAGGGPAVSLGVLAYTQQMQLASGTAPAQPTACSRCRVPCGEFNLRATDAYGAAPLEWVPPSGEPVCTPNPCWGRAVPQPGGGCRLPVHLPPPDAAGTRVTLRATSPGPAWTTGGLPVPFVLVARLRDLQNEVISLRTPAMYMRWVSPMARSETFAGNGPVAVRAQDMLVVNGTAAYAPRRASVHGITTDVSTVTDQFTTDLGGSLLADGAERVASAMANVWVEGVDGTIATLLAYREGRCVSVDPADCETLQVVECTGTANGLPTSFTFTSSGVATAQCGGATVCLQIHDGDLAPAAGPCDRSSARVFQRAAVSLASTTPRTGNCLDDLVLGALLTDASVDDGTWLNEPCVSGVAPAGTSGNDTTVGMFSPDWPRVEGAIVPGANATALSTCTQNDCPVETSTSGGAACSAQCAPGWGGDHCDLFVAAAELTDCAGHGNPVDDGAGGGMCACRERFAGAQCSTCAGNFIGPGCLQCSQDGLDDAAMCSGHGTARRGGTSVDTRAGTFTLAQCPVQCDCDTGWAGGTCDRCDAGNGFTAYDGGCTDCSRHGVPVVPPNATHPCACDAPFANGDPTCANSTLFFGVWTPLYENTARPLFCAGRSTAVAAPCSPWQVCTAEGCVTRTGDDGARFVPTPAQVGYPGDAAAVPGSAPTTGRAMFDGVFALGSTTVGALGTSDTSSVAPLSGGSAWGNGVGNCGLRFRQDSWRLPHSFATERADVLAQQPMSLGCTRTATGTAAIEAMEDVLHTACGDTGGAVSMDVDTLVSRTAACAADAGSSALWLLSPLGQVSTLRGQRAGQCLTVQSDCTLAMAACPEQAPAGMADGWRLTENGMLVTQHVAFADDEAPAACTPSATPRATFLCAVAPEGEAPTVRPCALVGTGAGAPHADDVVRATYASAQSKVRTDGATCQLRADGGASGFAMGNTSCWLAPSGVHADTSSSFVVPAAATYADANLLPGACAPCSGFCASPAQCFHLLDEETGACTRHCNCTAEVAVPAACGPNSRKVYVVADEECVEECECIKGYAGVACERCDTANGYSLDTATGNCTLCQNGGTASASGGCLCLPQWAGDAHCTTCATGYTGPECNTCTSGYGATFDADGHFVCLPCNHGTPLEQTRATAVGHGDQVCQCDSREWTGPTCNVPGTPDTTPCPHPNMQWPECQKCASGYGAFRCGASTLCDQYNDWEHSCQTGEPWGCRGSTGYAGVGSGNAVCVPCMDSSSPDNQDLSNPSSNPCGCLASHKSITCEQGCTTNTVWPTCTTCITGFVKMQPEQAENMNIHVDAGMVLPDGKFCASCWDGDTSSIGQSQCTCFSSQNTDEPVVNIQGVLCNAFSCGPNAQPNCGGDRTCNTSPVLMPDGSTKDLVLLSDPNLSAPLCVCFTETAFFNSDVAKCVYCDHGETNSAGDGCTCNSGWETDSEGACTVETDACLKPTYMEKEWGMSIRVSKGWQSSGCDCSVVLLKTTFTNIYWPFLVPRNMPYAFCGSYNLREVGNLCMTRDQSRRAMLPAFDGATCTESLSGLGSTYCTGSNTITAPLSEQTFGCKLQIGGANAFAGACSSNQINENRNICGMEQGCTPYQGRTGEACNAQAVCMFVYNVPFNDPDYVIVQNSPTAGVKEPVNQWLWTSDGDQLDVTCSQITNVMWYTGTFNAYGTEMRPGGSTVSSSL